MSLYLEALLYVPPALFKALELTPLYSLLKAYILKSLVTKAS